MRPLHQKMKKLHNVLFVVVKVETCVQEVWFSYLINLYSGSSLLQILMRPLQEAVQRALHGEEVKSGNRRDILNDHQAWNRPNKPPSQQQLLNAAKCQLQGASNTDVSDVDNNEDEEEGTRRVHAHRHKPAEADPKTAGHYPECWREAIDHAKELFRHFVILYNLFPNCDTHLQDAARILSQVTAKERSEGKPFNPSKTHISIIYDSNSSLCSKISSKIVIWTLL